MVEELAVMAQFLRPALDVYGLIFAGPEEAPRHLNERPIDLLLLDATVPVAPRIDVLAAAERNGVTTVVMTQDPDAERQYAGAPRCIPRPTGPDGLLQLLSEMLQPEAD